MNRIVATCSKDVLSDSCHKDVTLLFMFAVYIWTRPIWRDDHFRLNFAQNAPIRMTPLSPATSGYKWWILLIICCLYLNWLAASTRILSSMSTSLNTRIQRQTFRWNKFGSFTRTTLEVIFDSGLNSFTIMCLCLFIQNYGYRFRARELQSKKDFSK